MLVRKTSLTVDTPAYTIDAPTSEVAKVTTNPADTVLRILLRTPCL